MKSREEYAKQLEQEIEHQNNFYSVIVDGNNHKQLRGTRIVTPKETITIKKCKEIVAKIESKFGIEIKKIKIMMSEWDYRSCTLDDYIGACHNDWGLRQTINKNAYYYKNKNRLVIWQDGYPVYENYNGNICRDQDALVDCLM